MKQICLFYVFSILLAQIYGNGNSTCSTEMFGGDFNAYMACKTQFALQSNWFPSPIAGLFSYLVSLLVFTSNLLFALYGQFIYNLISVNGLLI